MDAEPLTNVMYLTSAYDAVTEEGQCHICLRKGKMTQEHIPPKNAFNGSTALWDRLVIPERASKSAHQVRLRGGFRVRTICRNCNNELCSPYANAYVQFVRHLVESPKLFDSSGSARLIQIPCDTLLLAKQIATMILAIQQLSYAKHNAGLREFVLNKESTYQPSFRVYAFLVPEVPEAGTITRFHGRVETFAPGYGFFGGEMSWFPFGFVYASQIGRKYDLKRFEDITRWFTMADTTDRNRDVVKLHCRVTGVDSIQGGLGKRRVRPQIDYIASVT
ncbi:MAG: hypothetical protein HUJ26_04550 [Planctomycetaceae bacterium]|nr:hypothetical protein [Planctomycetaceae bacterium]